MYRSRGNNVGVHAFLYRSHGDEKLEKSARMIDLSVLTKSMEVTGLIKLRKIKEITLIVFITVNTCLNATF
jgi:hypothetical protein